MRGLLGSLEIERIGTRFGLSLDNDEFDDCAVICCQCLFEFSG